MNICWAASKNTNSIHSANCFLPIVQPLEKVEKCESFQGQQKKVSNFFKSEKLRLLLFCPIYSFYLPKYILSLTPPL